jgi:AcrR family transcriptional regulator
MARPLSEDKRNAILAAATDAVALQGVGAPTARIAKQAGVAEGTLFTYFPTKDVLLNQLYLALKTELAATIAAGFPLDAALPDRWRHVWDRTIDWSAAYPAKHRAMRQLTVSDRITGQSKDIGNAAFLGIQAMIAETHTSGVLKDQSLEFMVATLEALGEMTLDFVAREPARRDHYKRAGFDAFWGAVGYR